MKRLKAEFHISTPCFLGGEDNRNVELRVPSIKGALRFWWRALSYAEYGGNIAQWSKKEKELFGSSDSDQGQSKFLMRLVLNSEPDRYTLRQGTVLKHGNKVVDEGVRYLGYGLMEAFGQKKGTLLRSCLSELDFSLHFLARNSDVLKEIVPALKVLGLLGSVGSRSRKGFGSLTLTCLAGDDISPWSNPANKEEYTNSLQTLLRSQANWSEEPQISAFSHQSRIDCLMEGSDSLQLMNDYGEAMVRYRSWKKEQRFKNDHDWFKEIGSVESDFHPKRAVFGLPHNYFSPPLDHAEVKPENYERRASPLFFHVHRYSKDRYAGIALLMRAQFLPRKERIKAKGRSVPANPDWAVLTSFLDNKKYFANRSALWPSQRVKGTAE